MDGPVPSREVPKQACRHGSFEWLCRVPHTAGIASCFSQFKYNDKFQMRFLGYDPSNLALNEL